MALHQRQVTVSREEHEERPHLQAGRTSVVERHPLIGRERGVPSLLAF